MIEYRYKEGIDIMKYFGTVTITLHGWFDADGEEEILDDALACASNVTIETEIVDLEDED